MNTPQESLDALPATVLAEFLVLVLVFLVVRVLDRAVGGLISNILHLGGGMMAMYK